MAQPTIKDVAKLAGVSISTVSRVMNKSKPVSPAAERRVIDAINKLGFKPNELARSLVMKKSNSIGVMVKDIGIEYMAQIIRGIEEIGKMYHYDILVSSTYGDPEAEKKAIDFLYRKQVEGMLIISENLPSETVVKIREYDLPYILLDRYYKANDYHTVAVNYRAGIAEMTRELLEMGHRSIVFMRSYENYDIMAEKQEGYEEAMRRAGLEPRVIRVKGLSDVDGYTWMQNNGATLQEDGTTAIQCSDDSLAIGVMNYCYDNGLAVPEKFSVTGYGDIEIAELYRPRLTTVKEPFYDIGAVAMRIMSKILQENARWTESIQLPTEVILRESTAAVEREQA